ncbi:MAG: phage tail tape measure protein [Candidatus Heimdallarchaeaceae archaeon]
MVLGGLAAGALGGAGINIVISAIDNFSKTFASAQTQVAGLSGFVQKHRAGIMMAGAAITGAMVGVAATSVKSFATFEEQMTNSMIMFDNVTDAQEKDAKELALTLSKELGMAATETAKSLWYFGSAGMDVNETLEAMPSVLKFAKVNLLDTGEAAGFAMTAMKVFGIEAKDMNKVLDQATFVMKNAKMNMNDLAEAMSYVGPVAANIGIEFSDLSILVGVLADAGINGSRAGTVLRQAIMRLTAPTGKAKDLIEEMGIEVFDANGEFKGIFPVLEQFEEKTKTMTDKEREFAMKTIFGVRQVAGMNAILKKGTKEMVKYSKEVKKTGGIIDEMMTEKAEDAAFQMEQFSATIEEMKISLGEALIPSLMDLLDILKPVIEAFTSLPAPVKTAVVFGGMLTGVLLLLAPAISALTPLMIAATGAATGLSAAMLTLGGIGMIALTIGFAFSAMSEEDVVKALEKIFVSSLAAGLAALMFGAGGPVSIFVGIATFVVLAEWKLDWVENISDWLVKELENLKEIPERFKLWAEGYDLGFWEILRGQELESTDIIYDLELGVAGTRREIERLRRQVETDFPVMNKTIAETGELIGKEEKGSYPIVYSLIQAISKWEEMGKVAIEQLSSIISKINEIPRDIYTTVHIKTVGGGFGVPFFQQGGTMPYTGLAYLHKGETIIPAGKSRNGEVNVYIENVYGTDPTEIAEALQEELNMKITT